MGALARAGSKEAAPRAPSALAAEAPISNPRRDSAKSALDISALLHSLAHMRGFDVSRHRPDRGPAGGVREQNDAITKASTRRYRQVKRPLQLGRRVRICRVIGECDQSAFAAG